MCRHSNRHVHGSPSPTNVRAANAIALTAMSTHTPIHMSTHTSMHMSIFTAQYTCLYTGRRGPIAGGTCRTAHVSTCACRYAHVCTPIYGICTHACPYAGLRRRRTTGRAHCRPTACSRRRPSRTAPQRSRSPRRRAAVGRSRARHPGSAARTAPSRTSRR